MTDLQDRLIDRFKAQQELERLYRRQKMETIKRVAIDMAACCLAIVSLMTIGIVLVAWLVGL